MVNGDELYHHGIKGQKWGIRRYQPYPKGSKGGKEIGAAAKRKKNSREATILQDRQNALANRRHLSDDELRQRINRLRLEQDFKNLSKRDVEKGEGVIKKAFKNRGVQILTTAAFGAAIYAVRQALLKKPFDSEGLINAALPAGKKKNK